MTNTDHLAALLEAAGEDRAAEIIRAAHTAQIPATPNTEAEAEAEQPALSPDQQEAQYLLQRLQEQTSRQWHSTPVFPENAA